MQGSTLPEKKPKTAHRRLKELLGRPFIRGIRDVFHPLRARQNLEYFQAFSAQEFLCQATVP